MASRYDSSESGQKTKREAGMAEQPGMRAMELQEKIGKGQDELSGGGKPSAEPDLSMIFYRSPVKSPGRQ